MSSRTPAARGPRPTRAARPRDGQGRRREPEAPGEASWDPELDRLNSAVARSVCLDLPGAYSDFPFGPEAEVVRVSGRIFALFLQAADIAPGTLMNLKAAPDEVPLLVSSYPFLLPGYHMNKKHWISVALAADPDMELVASLIEDSYDNVRLALPAGRRPVLAPQPVRVELSPAAEPSAPRRPEP